MGIKIFKQGEARRRSTCVGPPGGIAISYATDEERRLA